jgi:hypothetical protein
MAASFGKERKNLTTILSAAWLPDSGRSRVGDIKV